MNKLFYNSSMPRAGSSILQNLIGQNPDFYVTPTSGLLELIYTVRNTYANTTEFMAQDTQLMEKAFINFCKEGMKGFCEAQTDKKYVLDKSRGWGVHKPLLDLIYDKPKVITMVRDLRDIVASMENKYRKNPLHFEKMIDMRNLQGTTVGKRADLFLNTQPIGLALDRLQDIFTQGIDKDMLFIKFEDLCVEKQYIMDAIYNYLEVKPYTHNFNHVEQITHEDDKLYGIYGDHKINSKIELPKSSWKTILGEDIGNYIYNKYKWYFDIFGYRK